MSQSVRVDIYVNPVDLKGFVFLVSSTISAVALFLPPLLQGLLSLVMMDLMETSHVGLSVPRSLSLCIMFGYRYLNLFSYAAGRNFSDEGRARH